MQLHLLCLAGLWYTATYAQQNATTTASPAWNWTTWALAPTGTGIDYASRCEQAQNSWTFDLSSTIAKTIPATRNVSGFYVHSTSTFLGTYTTCMNVTRAASVTRTTWSNATFMLYTTSRTLTSTVVWPSPSPICTYGSQECTGVWTQYFAATAAWSKNSIASIETLSLARPPSSMVYNGKTTALVAGPWTGAPTLTIGTRTITPLVGMSGTKYINGNRTVMADVLTTKYPIYSTFRHDDFLSVVVEPGQLTTWTMLKQFPRTPHCRGQFTTGLPGQACTVIADYTAKLLFFPVTTAHSRDDCATTDSKPPLTGMPAVWPTPKPMPTEPMVNISGTMFDPRSAYLSISSIWAYAENAEIGRNYKNVLLAVDPAHLVTMKRTSPFSNTKTEYYSLGLSDLRQPVPLSVYMGLQDCQYYDCRQVTIVDNEYIPHVALPPEARLLDPAWSDCEVGTWVPATPVPIVSAQPTPTLTLATLPPSPKSTFSAGIPVETASSS